MLRVAATARCEYFESVDRRLVGEKTHAKVKGGEVKGILLKICAEMKNWTCPPSKRIAP